MQGYTSMQCSVKSYCYSYRFNAEKMSRRNQKKEEDNIPGKVLTGIAVGVTVAAAGAAIGYLGKQIFGAWQASQEKEQKSSASNYAEKFTESDDFKRLHVSNSYQTERQFDKITPASTPSAECVNLEANVIKKSPVLLHDQLMKYYKEYVEIPKADIISSGNVVNEVLSALSRYIKDPKLLKLACLKVGDLGQFGSFTEDLTVIRPDKFDVMIPIRLVENFEMRAAEGCEGSVHLEVQPGVVSNSSITILCDANYRLMPRKLASCLLDPFQQACLNLRFNVEAALNNSVITLTVMKSDGQRKLCINFVPAVIIGTKLCMPNDIPLANKESGNHWYTSYARQEQWAIDRFDNTIYGHRTALKIMKAIRINHLEQFGQISSYHLKHVLFHVLEDLPDSSDWTDDAVGERLIDLLARLIQVLNDHTLPHYFEPTVNLLYWVPKTDCINLAKFIEKKLGFNDIQSLLERRY